jgi:hypothetical protein
VRRKLRLFTASHARSISGGRDAPNEPGAVAHDSASGTQHSMVENEGRRTRCTALTFYPSASRPLDLRAVQPRRQGQMYTPQDSCSQFVKQVLQVGSKQVPPQVPPQE